MQDKNGKDLQQSTERIDPEIRPKYCARNGIEERESEPAIEAVTRQRPPGYAYADADIGKCPGQDSRLRQSASARAAHQIHADLIADRERNQPSADPKRRQNNKKNRLDQVERRKPFILNARRFNGQRIPK